LNPNICIIEMIDEKDMQIPVTCENNQLVTHYNRRTQQLVYKEDSKEEEKNEDLVPINM